MNRKLYQVRFVLVGLACLSLARPGFAQTEVPTLVPPVPVMKSPMDSFRALLVMPSAERREQLASRPLEVQQKLIAKVREYQALTPEERELRLKATELRWYLKPLMSVPMTNRAAQLALIPENIRDMVAVRIAQWDKLPLGFQQSMLTNQAGPDYLVVGTRTNLPPLPTEKLRSHLQQRFNRIFELTTAEQEKVLATLSDPERRQMEITLAAYEQLTPPQRERCIASFVRFRGMSAFEQQEFLRNAERWAQMTPEERQAWREIVSMTPRVPPLPQLTRKMPPLPPNSSKPRDPSTTNGG